MTTDALRQLSEQVESLRRSVAELLDLERDIVSALPVERRDAVRQRLDEIAQHDARPSSSNRDGHAEFGAAWHVPRLDVERINVVEPDGTLRLTISNKALAPDPIIGGRTLKRQSGNQAGLIFFNDVGDECGGLVWGIDGDDDDRQHAGAAILFDQFHNDQTVGITYDQTGIRRTAGLHVWDRPDVPLAELVDRYQAIQRLPPAEQQAARAQLQAEGLGGAKRIFVGKNAEREAVVDLHDGHGAPRLRLIASDDGAARIEFLDAHGEVVARVPSNDVGPEHRA